MMKNTYILKYVLRIFFALSLSLPLAALADMPYQIKFRNDSADNSLYVQYSSEANDSNSNCFSTWQVPPSPALLPPKTTLQTFTVVDKSALQCSGFSAKATSWIVSVAPDTGGAAPVTSNDLRVTLYHTGDLGGATWIAFDYKNSNTPSPVTVKSATCNGANCLQSTNSMLPTPSNPLIEIVVGD